MLIFSHFDVTVLVYMLDDLYACTVSNSIIISYVLLFPTEGPYLISCHDGTIFLKVVQDENDHAFVYATTKTEDTSYFYIVLTDDGNNPYEFYIGWQKSEATNKPGTMRYLNAPLSISGYNNGPLTLESLGKKQNSIFSVNSRLMDSFCGLLLRHKAATMLIPRYGSKA